VLSDVSSSYFEGRKCPLAKFGHSRDDRRNKLQIVFGLLCAPDGCPVAAEVFPGNTSDPATLASAIATVRERFGVRRVILVVDRGLATEARMDAELRPVEGLDWINALSAPQAGADRGCRLALSRRSS
jgi:transposase